MCKHVWKTTYGVNEGESRITGDCGQALAVLALLDVYGNRNSLRSGSSRKSRSLAPTALKGACYHYRGSYSGTQHSRSRSKTN